MNSLRRIRDILNQLFSLSVRQLDAFDREDFNELENLLDQKAALLKEFDRHFAEARKGGWSPTDESTEGQDGIAPSDVRQVNQLIQRFQSHEKYVISQVMARRNQIGERLCRMMVKRSAAAGYNRVSSRGRALDRAL